MAEPLSSCVIELLISQAQLDEQLDVLSLLADASPSDCRLNRTQVKQAMQKGALWLQSTATKSHKKKVQRLRRLSRVLKLGDKLFLYYDQQVLNQQPQAAQLIFDAGTYSVWYKPYGMYAQGSKWGDHCTINRWSEVHLQPQRPAFIVHRLDRATSGLIILAHKKSSAAALGAMFEQHHLTKVYHALVHGEFAETATPLTINRDIDGRSARSHVSLIKVSTCRKYSLVSVSIDTGRKHQIRRHLSDLGFPIVGDRLYGIAEGNEPRDLQLVSTRLSFICPITAKAQSFTLPLELQQKL